MTLIDAESGSSFISIERHQAFDDAGHSQGSSKRPQEQRAAAHVRSAKPLLLCFSHLRWDFVWQRPQHLLTRAAKHFDIVFLEEPVFEADVMPHLAMTARSNGIRVGVPHLPVGLDEASKVDEQRSLVRGLLAEIGDRSVVFWYYDPMAVAFSEDLRRDLTVYDNMDELSAFRGASPELLSREEAVLRDADVVFAGGLSLCEAKRGRHANLHAFPSSIDVDHFARARLGREVQTSTSGAEAPLRLGFFGVIDERFDVDLLDELAALRPEWHIDIVGPVVKIDPATLPDRPNINWLGSCQYDRLPERLATWDIGIMPFAINEATRFISPTKTPEFLAAGLPVVSTAIVDVVRSYGKSGLVEIATCATQFASAIERILESDRETWLREVDRHLSTSSWDATWAAMFRLMTEAGWAWSSDSVKEDLNLPGEKHAQSFRISASRHWRSPTAAAPS